MTTQCRARRPAAPARAPGPVPMLALALALVLLPTGPLPTPPAAANQLGAMERIDIDTFASLREVERYQLRVAEKYFLDEEYAVALDEYDKFLTLYEASDAAPYALLMWAHCQRRLRHVNTAIREGYQLVIDYWPDSREARMASFLIGEAYVSIGETAPGAAAFRKVIEDHPDHHLAVRSKLALLDLAEVADDQQQIDHWLEQLAFHTERTEAAESDCVAASRRLAARRFGRGDLDGAREALATSYQGAQEVLELQDIGTGIVGRQIGSDDEGVQRRAAALGAHLLELLEGLLPDDLADDDQRTFTRDLLVRMAAVHGAIGDQDQIRETWERMGRLLGMDDSVRARLAGWHKANDDRPGARRIYAAYDNRINGRRQLVAMDREESLWDQAIEGYRALIQIDEDRTVEYLGEIAACHQSAGRIDETIATYQELIQADPDNAGDYHWAIAEVYHGAGRLREAIQAFRLADRFPQNYFRMADCHRRLEQWQEALTLYQQIKAAGESVPEADLQTAFTLEQAGQREQALRAFQYTCHTHPRSQQASRAHAHVQEKYDISITLGGATDD